MVVSREVWDLRDGTPTNKKKHQQQENTFRARENAFQQTRKILFRREKRLSSKGYLPIKCKSLQVVGVSRQGEAVVSDGRYGIIGGRYCLLVWGDAEETKGNEGDDGVGLAPLVVRPCFLLAVV